jgi:hypothetical protein
MPIVFPVNRSGLDPFGELVGITCNSELGLTENSPINGRS